MGTEKEIHAHYGIWVDGEYYDMGEVKDIIDIGGSWITTEPEREVHLYLKFKDGTVRHFVEVE